jgi:hypothetical protein
LGEQDLGLAEQVHENPMPVVPRHVGGLAFVHPDQVQGVMRAAQIRRSGGGQDGVVAPLVGYQRIRGVASEKQSHRCHG